MRLTIAEIARAAGATGVIGCSGGQAEAVLTGVRIDSREAGPGDLFVCLPGSRVDGHEYAAQAAARGAGAVLASRPVEAGVPVLLVEDTARALAGLASCQRRLCGERGLRVMAVTGSAGKTTVKELAAAILGRDFAVAKSFKNFNNQIGLPLSILNTTGDEDVWVLEVGISRKGDMDELGPIVRPDLAVIHNIGPAHLEGLGSLEGVARAKASLLRYLAPGGRALVSADYPELMAEALRILPDVAAFSSQGRRAAWACRYLGASPDGRGRFELNLAGESFQLALPWRGAHFAENIAAAAAAAKLLGGAAESVRQGLAEAALPAQRFNCQAARGWTIIDDTYNANPLSMLRAIESAREMADGKPLVLVLGEMAELGATAAEAHRELGCAIGRTGCAAVFFNGDHLEELKSGAPERVFPAEAPETLAERVEALGIDKGVILFKGSRSRKMESYLKAFMGRLCGGEALA